ncbi:hypothetical protein F0562_029253 [Nyssa sinensis]|uniref:GATA-type domain-containing protein n=1 Tax=Nyssa sinensis TaxID=561372 RepID=A0A5J5B0J5_9ASTE|nr:hypothetical protein F0562_029253 [Nyssa sinensis]
MDPSQKESLSEETDETKKCCADCKTTKTPLWRVGPSGPKSLCNACGIRYRKKRSGVVGVIKGIEKRKEKPTTTIITKKTNSGFGNGKLRETLKVRLMALGKELVMFQRQRSRMKRHSSSRMLGEEEQAAVLLMALSRGSVFA